MKPKEKKLRKAEREARKNAKQKEKELRKVERALKQED